jgi:hypothetical protein
MNVCISTYDCISYRFKIGGGEDSNIKVKNGCSYGKGVYSSEHPGAAIQYGRGSGCVILAKGLVISCRCF